MNHTLIDALGLTSTEQEQVELSLSQGVSLVESLSSCLGESESVIRMAACLDLDSRLSVAELVPDTEWLAQVPPRVWASARLLPLENADGELHVACADPEDQRGLSVLRVFLAGRTPKLVLVPQAVLTEAMSRYLGVGADTVQSLVDGRADEVVAEGEVDLVDQAEDASIVRLVNQVLQEALEKRATDVHFEPFEGRFAVRYRVDGVLVEAKLPPEVRRLRGAIVSRIKILAQLDIAEKRLPQDGRIKMRLAGREVDVRVSVIPMLHGEAVVLRLLDRGTTMVGLDVLGMTGTHRELFHSALDMPHGIVLVTGPTGSGKTTSLYAGLQRINKPDLKIVTIEDPVEYHLDGINQIQVDTRTGLTFARGLRAVLRHDPDVVLVGEIRDRETAEIAVQASLTGHLVLSTLHTNDAPGAVNRLSDMGVESYLVASTLELVLAQRLVRLLCPLCKQRLEGQDKVDALHTMGVADGELYMPSEAGCAACFGLGYKGRKAIFEMMPITSSLRHATSESVPSQRLREMAVGEGMVSLRQDGYRLVCEGHTSLQEVMRNTHEEMTLQKGRD